MRKGKLKHSEAKKNKEFKQKKEESRKHLNKNESVNSKKMKIANQSAKSAKMKKIKVKSFKAKKVKAIKLTEVNNQKSTALAKELNTAFLSNENAMLNSKNLNHAAQIVNKDLENKGLSYNLASLIASNKVSLKSKVIICILL